MIRLENITLQIASKFLLEDTSVQISDGQKVGIVGNNGCGKTTLFKVLKGEHEVNLGDVIFSKNQQQAFVEQEIKEEDLNKSIVEYVLSKDVKLMSLRKKERECSPEELPEILEELRLIEADSATARTAEILAGLSFNNEDLTKPVKDFSGGWQMRLNLAGALFQYSDTLLLDEPTNHLDLEAIVWLESYLAKYKGTILLISHDRDFLNNVCKQILHFEGKKLVLYGGNYDNYERTYQQKIELVGKQIKKQDEKEAHLQAYVDRFRYKASKAKQAQSRLKQLDKLERIDEVAVDKESHFTFPFISQLASPLITLDNASTGYGDKIILKKLDLCINQDDRIGLLGKNGNGKSTFVKLISSHIQLKNGDMRKSGKLKIGYFNQNQTEELPLDMTPVAYMMSLLPDKKEHQIRSQLSRFGLEQEKSITQINKLSGGEKTRLLFARISIDSPELLIFDEPTNHLDMTGRRALIEAINEYNGAIILISHDFYLLENSVDNLWLVHNNTCVPFDGNLKDYRKFLLAPDKKVKEDKKETKVVKATKPNRKDRVAIRELEQQLNKLEREKSNLMLRFGIESDGQKIAKMQKDLHQLEQQITTTEEKWLAMSEN